MKDEMILIQENKLLLTIDNSTFEKEAILQASYKFTDKCYISIDNSNKKTEVYFQSKNETEDLERIAQDFKNEIIDQQVRLQTGREFKEIREELVKRAFSSISK